MGAGWRWETFGVALLVAACGDGTVEPGPINDEEEPPPTFDIEGSWSARGGLPEPLTGVSAAGWLGGLYVVGGYADAQSGTATRHVLRFDLATGRRTVLNDYPEEVAEGALVTYRDTLLMIGGNGGSESSLAVRDAMRWYDEANDSWEAWGLLPERRFRHTAHVVGDELLVIGGRNLFQPPGDSIVVFDGRTSRYGPPPNRAYTEPMNGGVIGDTVFIMTSAFDSRVLQYDAQGEAWADGFGHPLAGAATGGVLNGRLHAFSFGRTAAHRVWDPSATAWLTAPMPSTPVELAATVAIDGSLWLIGGHDRERIASDRMQIFTPN